MSYQQQRPLQQQQTYGTNMPNPNNGNGYDQDMYGYGAQGDEGYDQYDDEQLGEYDGRNAARERGDYGYEGGNPNQGFSQDPRQQQQQVYGGNGQLGPVSAGGQSQQYAQNQLVGKRHSHIPLERTPGVSAGGGFVGDFMRRRYTATFRGVLMGGDGCFVWNPSENEDAWKAKLRGDSSGRRFGDTDRILIKEVRVLSYSSRLPYDAHVECEALRGNLYGSEGRNIALLYGGHVSEKCRKAFSASTDTSFAFANRYGNVKREVIDQFESTIMHNGLVYRLLHPQHPVHVAITHHLENSSRDEIAKVISEVTTFDPKERNRVMTAEELKNSHYYVSQVCYEDFSIAVAQGDSQLPWVSLRTFDFRLSRADGQSFSSPIGLPGIVCDVQTRTALPAYGDASTRILSMESGATVELEVDYYIAPCADGIRFLQQAQNSRLVRQQ